MGNDKDLLYALITRYTTAIAYDIWGNPEYAGEAATGSVQSAPVWRIMKIIYDVSSNPVSVLWAGGNQKFDKIWDDHTSYTYS